VLRRGGELLYEAEGELRGVNEVEEFTTEDTG
jgi:hypothetical protein